MCTDACNCDGLVFGMMAFRKRTQRECSPSIPCASEERLQVFVWRDEFIQMYIYNFRDTIRPTSVTCMRPVCDPTGQGPTLVPYSVECLGAIVAPHSRPSCRVASLYIKNHACSQHCLGDCRLHDVRFELCRVGCERDDSTTLACV